MATPDDIRSGLRDAATSIDVGDLDTARSDVRGVARRRQVRARAAAGLGLGAVVIVGAILVSTGADEPGMLVISDPTIEEAAVDSSPAAGPPPTAEVMSPPTAIVLERAGVAGSGAGQNGAPEFAEWAAPWRDGFLVGRYVFPPQPLPEQLPDDVRALFPQEVLDLFVDGLPPTVGEATDMLSDAGLLDEVSTVLAEHPEASAAIYGDPVTTVPTVEARFTTDGMTWEPVEMTLPPGASYLASLASVDDRLVVVYDERSATGPLPVGSDDVPVVSVATTTDLVNWTIQEISPPVPPIDLPDGIDRLASAQGLVANSTGWAVTVHESIQPDVMRLLPEDVRARFENDGAASNGVGMAYDDTGVTIESYGADGAIDSVRYGWDELGIAPDVVAYLSGNELRSQVWAATWDGEPTRSDGPVGSGMLVATSAGFLQWNDQLWFSSDGITWTPRPLPDPDGNVSAAFAFDGGVILAAVDADGVLQLHRLDETGGSPELVDLPGLPDQFQTWFGSPSVPASALIVDAAVQAPVAPLEVDVDGYRLTIDRRTGTFTLTDLASGQSVASERGPSVGSTGSAFSFGSDGLTVTDPTTGDVVVVISNEIMAAADEEALEEVEGGEYVSDLWLLATSDGERFVVDDLDDRREPAAPVTAVVNRDVALVFMGDTWIRYDLS